jgi:serine/threonine-protein kinase
MLTRIGHFEILSELSKSATGRVYKANDPQAGKHVALKVINLSAFGTHADELVKRLLQEAETTKVLSNPNLTVVYGAGEIDGQFCAAMDYIQGNSVATMLARKEGFSIWDLIDIGRQVCGALDHAHSHRIFHYSLEPAKIMNGWDGGVRVLGFGVSSMGKFAAQIPGVPPILHYMSPEQIQGAEIDARSNIFSLAALFYEMVTDRKAFDGADTEALRKSILESTPAPPVRMNLKLHPRLSDLIMKAMAKDPAERYQTGRDLLDDLEKCKDSNPQAAKAAAWGAPNSASAAGSTMAAAKPPSATKPARPVLVPAEAATHQPPIFKPAPARANPAAQAAASLSSAGHGTSALGTRAAKPVNSASPRIAVDPMMAESAPSAGSGVSFSEMTELPPLKEIYIAPSPAPTQPLPLQATDFRSGIKEKSRKDKPRVLSGQAAGSAFREIRAIPPRLMLYSILAAAVLIFVISAGLSVYVHQLNREEDSAHAGSTAVNTAAAASQPSPAQTAPAQPPNTAAPEDKAVHELRPAPTHSGAARGKAARKKSSIVPAALLGQVAVDSTPQGAQVQLDGQTDPSWITPVTLTGLEAGHHTVTISKEGYAADSHPVELDSGAKSFVVSHLTPLTATLSVTSTPAGASVYIDGRDTGKLTPAQVPVEKGRHVVLVRKSGFIDETLSSQFVLSQTIAYSPTLRALGNVDDLRTVSKIKKLFGGKDSQGMGTIAIRTQPRGAQVAVNQHMLDKPSPVDFMLDPGNYVIDITLTGYTPIHRVITVDKNGKAVLDEVMQHD